MFTSEFDAEVDESESATLQQYYREAMIQGYTARGRQHLRQSTAQSFAIAL